MNEYEYKLFRWIIIFFIILTLPFLIVVIKDTFYQKCEEQPNWERKVRRNDSIWDDYWIYNLTEGDVVINDGYHISNLSSCPCKKNSTMSISIVEKSKPTHSSCNWTGSSFKYCEGIVIKDGGMYHGDYDERCRVRNELPK